MLRRLGEMAAKKLHKSQVLERLWIYYGVNKDAMAERYDKYYDECPSHAPEHKRVCAETGLEKWVQKVTGGN